MRILSLVEKLHFLIDEFHHANEEILNRTNLSSFYITGPMKFGQGILEYTKQNS